MRLYTGFFMLAVAGTAVLAGAESEDAQKPEARDGVWQVRDFGAVPGGEVDATVAFQRALNAAHEAGGGIVNVPTGRYRFDGTLTIPRNVTLRGTFTYAPAHAGIRDRSDELPLFGSVLEPYAGRGSAEGPAFIRLESNAALQGVTIHYPAQDPHAEAPVPYPWAVQMRGNNPAIMDVQLLNPYNGIDAKKNQRALIRNVHGQPIHIGLVVDEIYDIGRIENVHWNPWWSLGTPIFDWQMEHGVGFIFARTDWHYVLNTFCFGYNVGYLFTNSEHGAANGNFLGIGADNCNTAVLIEETAPMGILITNGEFVSFEGPDPTMVRVLPSHTGTVRFANSAFWGPSQRNALIEGHGTIGFSDCTFMQWGHHENTDTRYKDGVPSIDARGGSLILRGCEWMEDKAQVYLGPDVERAIITGNLINGSQRIQDEARGTTIIRDNAATPTRWNVRPHFDEAPGFRAWTRREAREE